MKRVAILVLFFVLSPAILPAGIIFTAPSVTVNSGSLASLTLTATVNGSFDVTSYEFQMDLTGRNGASGVTFTGASLASSSYFFTKPVDPLTTVLHNPPTVMYCEDGLQDRSATETIANVTRNLVTLNLNILPGTVGVFDLTFDPNWSAVYKNSDTIPGVTFVGGTINVIPQPSVNEYFSGTNTWDQNTTAKWSYQSGGPYNQIWSSGSSAVFEGTPGTVTVSGTVSSVNSIAFTTDGYTLGGTGTITLTGNGGSITTGAGADTINAKIAGGVGLTKQGSGTLTLTAANSYTGQTIVKAGTLELGPAAQSPVLSGAGANILAGRLVFDYIAPGNDPAATIQSLLTASYNAGVSSWTTGQFTTNTQGGTIWLGSYDNPTTHKVSIAATLQGDVNCDGTVDGTDLGLLINNMGTGTTWGQGDVNYSATVDGSDLGDLINNMGKSAPVSSGVVITQMGLNTVPEPSTLVLLASGLIGLLAYAWRRR